jgi:uncharacterized membrane protein
MQIFEEFGVAGLLRYLHVVSGVAWIGLLWYFNFVQTPAFAEMEAAARNNAIDKLVPRALWWFRWAAASTFLFGLLILGWGASQDTPNYFDGDYFKAAPGMSIWTGVLLGTTMAANVWMVIWPNQRTVIANARNVQAGGEADPAAAGAARTAALASRMNTIFSIPMLLFMVFTSHVFNVGFEQASGGELAIFWIVTLAIWAALELNALGYIGGKDPGGTNVIYDTHQNAIITGVVLAVFWYLFLEVLVG